MSKNKNFSAFIKFGIVGISGTIIDFLTFFLLTRFANFSIFFAASVGFSLAVVNNYFWNRVWTFDQQKSKNVRKEFFKFLIISIFGLFLTQIFLSIFIFLGVLDLVAKILTSGVVAIWNFLGNNFWTFREKNKNFSFPKKFKFEISIIIPAFNEKKRIKNTLFSVADFFKKERRNFEILVVDDGSKDDTYNFCQKIKSKIPEIEILQLKKNQGKGAAIRAGIFAANGEKNLICDADGSTPISEFLKLEKFKNKIVIGSRNLPKSKVDRSKFRNFIAKSINFFIRFFLIPGIFDTQCGFKLIEANTAREIFSRAKINRFAFDVEILVIAKYLQFSISEVPIKWSHKDGSRIRPFFDSILVIFDFLKIKFNLLAGRYF